LSLNEGQRRARPLVLHHGGLTDALLLVEGGAVAELEFVQVTELVEWDDVGDFGGRERTLRGASVRRCSLGEAGRTVLRQPAMSFFS